MPAKRELTMRQIRQMLRLHYERVGERQIARTLGIARSTVQDNLKRALKAGIAWPVPAELTDDVLEQQLFGSGGVKPGRRRHHGAESRLMADSKKSPFTAFAKLYCPP
mgnify:CR=1 FL=1